jgi:hypothetical protein
MRIKSRIKAAIRASRERPWVPGSLSRRCTSEATVSRNSLPLFKNSLSRAVLVCSCGDVVVAVVLIYPSRCTIKVLQSPSEESYMRTFLCPDTRHST